MSGMVRCFVKVDGEIVHDESFVNELKAVDAISYPGIVIHGQRVEVGFEFDPPLIVAKGE